ncbi:hypothetical protein DUNSADRAFT_8666 [Dunaliella salina]|uniref:Encoded protein n=1 Tax=Dunaliella salina TaxID=3046 RepID=A0ABQ7GJ51_DUNSA|nr:hypothetical protein DUNSADRAFT_8666 [Dunaliella salina]|eukprot:KAF5834625.1 hypothetical protein DUNSADRAFT_8666 [Dunaliella salina]
MTPFTMESKRQLHEDPCMPKAVLQAEERELDRQRQERIKWHGNDYPLGKPSKPLKTYVDCGKCAAQMQKTGKGVLLQQCLLCCSMARVPQVRVRKIAKRAE